MKTAKRGKRVVVVMPAYNAEKTLIRTLDDIDRSWVDDIILVDDGSRDGTVDLARRLGLRVFVHEKNTGYGGNQKTCYTEAMKLGGEIMVMIHPDHQYDP
nr:glycosyltransferase [Candidatus Aminicenantes bacterium]